ncbi:unnamed protein product [Symbiodinium natans]|uniref:Transmembrane protein n=1 Tax=Symbiodinium natans TaxID=878477 RepID=A0A812N1I5_9DINO|nr:unnamed protein product [Symbiodinium natans]
MLAAAALTRRTVQTRPCRAVGLTARLAAALVCFVLLCASNGTQWMAARNVQKLSATLKQILATQARASADEVEAERHGAKATEDEAAEARDEAEADRDEVAAEADRAEEDEEKGKAAAEETKAAEEEAEAETESSEVAADETAADTAQAGAAAEGARAGEEEAEADADEAAEAALTFVPFLDVVADTVGTAAAVGLQAAAAADTAEAAELGSESVAERAAEADAQAALVKTRAAEAEASSTEARDSAAAKEAEEAAEGEEADEARAKADEAAKDEDAAKQDASAAAETADAEQSEALAARKFLELVNFAILAAFFALLSLVLAIVPALFLLGKWVVSGLSGIKRTCQQGCELVLGPCRRSAASMSWASRPSVDCLHGFTLALMASGFLFPVVASAVRKLGREELRLGNFKETHKSPAVLLHNFEVLAPTIEHEIGKIVVGSFVVFLWTMLLEVAFMLERLRRTSMPLSRRFCWVVQGAADMACVTGLASAAGSVVVLSWSRSLWLLFSSADTPRCSSISLVLELSIVAALLVEIACRCQWAPPCEEMPREPREQERGKAPGIMGFLKFLMGFLADSALVLLQGAVSAVEGAMTLSSGWMLCSLVMFAVCVWKLALPYALPRVKAVVSQQWRWLLSAIVLLELVDLAYIIIRLRLWHRRGVRGDRQGRQGAREALLPE